MLSATFRRAGLPVALTAGAAAAVALAVSLGASLARLEASAAGASLAFLCELVGPPVTLLGAVLAPAALAVMAPCLLQLAAVLVSATAGVAASAAPRGLWRAGLAFAAGFLGVYVGAAALLALAGQALAPWAFALRALGGALLALLGLAVLRVLPRGAVPACRGPRWLILTGRASLRRPAGAGVAFAVYCLGCCGPYLAGVGLLGASAGSAAATAGVVLGFALAMALLLLLPIFALGAGRRVQAALARNGAAIALPAGAALVALGVALALEPLVVFLLVR
jgi:cytochrome c biogenesis protein CcdA